jgi:hypothetical protein
MKTKIITQKLFWFMLSGFGQIQQMIDQCFIKLLTQYIIHYFCINTMKIRIMTNKRDLGNILLVKVFNHGKYFFSVFVFYLLPAILLAQETKTDTIAPKSDTAFLSKISKDSIEYSILLSGRVSGRQENINVGDRVLIKLLSSKFEKHKVTSIYEYGFVIDGIKTIYPHQIQRIAKFKNKFAQNILIGSLLTITGFGLWTFAGSVMFDTGDEGSINSLVLGGAVLIIGGTTAFLIKQSTFNIMNGDKIFFVQKPLN